MLWVVQVSNDVRMLLPLLVGILAAKWVADAATHSLYHGLLEVCPCSKIPFILRSLPCSCCRLITRRLP